MFSFFTYSKNKLAGELCNTVQDAFIIGVEQQARERLKRLSALKRITPVDITQLSIKVRCIIAIINYRLKREVVWCRGNRNRTSI